VHANEDFTLVVGGKKRTVHIDVQGDCDLDKKTGKVFLHHARLRVQIEGQPFVIDTNQEGRGDDGDSHGSENGSITRVAITGPSDAVISGTWAGTLFTVTLHDGGASNKNDTVRVQYGSFDTGTQTLKHSGVHVQHH
jgi:hypothetical protein